MKKLILLTMICSYIVSFSQAPTAAAAAPTHSTATSSIKSIYSDAYTSIGVNQWGPIWSAGANSYSDVTIAGNATKLLDLPAGKEYGAIDFATNKFNATGYTHLRMDYYIPGSLLTGQVLVIKLSNHDGSGETNAIEYSVPTITTGQWVSLDIPLASFTVAGGGSLSRNNIAQMVITAARANVGGTALSIYLDNIYFYGPVAAPPSTSSKNIILNGNFSNGLTNWTSFLASWIPVNATINATNNEANVTGISGAGGETWHIQLNQIFISSQKDSLVIGKKYKISFFARGASARPLKLFFGEDGGGFVALLQKSYTLTTSMTKYEDTFTLTNKFAAMKLGFEGGLSNADFFIDSISLEEEIPPPPTKNIILNGGFGSGLTDWTSFLASWIPVNATINATNNEANFTGITGAGGETWHIQLNQIFTASQRDSLVIGKKYKIIFFARGASARPLKVFFGEDGGGFTALLQKSYTLSTTMTKYEDTFTLTSKFGAMKLGFEGGLSNSDFYIDDVSLEEVPPPSTKNIIINGNYSNALNDWTPFLASWIPVNATINATNNEVNVTGITGAGGESWHIQLNQIFTASQRDSLVIGKKYKITFFARGAAARPLKVFFGEDGGGFAAILQKSYNLTTTMTKYEDTFTLGNKYSAMKLGFEGGLSNVDFFIDDVSLEEETNISIPTLVPTVAAPTPPIRSASDVVSIFSDAYAKITPINYDAGWCGAPSIDKTTAGGDSVIAFKDKACQGIDFGTAVQTLTGLTHIHIDLFIAAGTSLVGKVFNLKVVPTSGAESEFPIDINALSPAPVPGTWYSYDVPVTFSGPVSGIKEFGITSNLANAVWYDNLYFYKNPTTSSGLTPAPAPTRAAANVISVFSDAYTNIVGTDLNPSWGQATQNSQFPISGNNTLKFKSLNYQGIQLGSTQNLTAAGMTHLHIDYLTPQTGTFKIFLISPGPKEVSYNLTIPTTGWMSLDIPLTSFPAPVDLSQIIQIKFDNGNPGTNPNFTDSVLIDNIYFYKEVASTALTPAPTPTRAAADVISIFSDTYTNVANTDLNPNWGQATQTSQFPISGNNTIKMKSLNYQGIQFGSTQNLTAAGMTHLHIDYRTPQTGTLRMFLISTGPNEQSFSLTIPTTGWTSLDIPLTSFPAPVDLTQVIQIKFDNGNPATNPNFTDSILIDNIYFFKNTVTPPPPPVTTDSIKFPLTFEQSTVSFIFSNIGTATTSLVANPDINAINPSAKVSKTTKGTGATPLSGASLQFPSNIDLLNATSIKMQVWSPLAFIKVRVRLQSILDPNKFIDLEQTLNAPNSWQELEFILPRIVGSAAKEYQKIAIFFDTENSGTGADFFFDNIQLLKSSSRITNVSFTNITIFPNPATNYLHIESLVSIDLIEIYSINGKKVFSKNLRGTQLDIDVRNLSQGHYILRAFGKDKVSNINFIKE